MDRPRATALKRRPLLLAILLWQSGAFGQDPSDDAENLLLAQVAPPPLAYFADFESVPGGARRELAGLRVNGREMPGGIELLRDGDAPLRLPLRMLAAVLNLVPGQEIDALRLETPLGSVSFQHAELRFGGGEAYVPLDVLAQRLSARVELDETAYAIVIELPWSTQIPSGSSAEHPVQPDIDAPGIDLARLRGQVWWQRDSQGLRRGSLIEAGGRLGPGSWQLRQSVQDGSTPRWHDYHWRVRHGDWLGQAGHQRVGTHPLLPSFELTGIQGAWSNASDRLYSVTDPDRLVTDRPGAVRSFRGDGPPAGVAELWIEGRIVARQRIALDGRFEFVNVAMPVGQSEVEIVLYEYENSAVPVARLDYSDRASDRLLGRGERLVHGGFGRDGNPLDDTRPDRGSAGFVRGRMGISERVSVEAGLQSSAAGEHALVSGDADLGLMGVGSAAYAHGNGHSAWLLGLDGSAGPLFWRGFATDRESGFRTPDSLALREHSAEFGWRHWPRWEVSMVARRRSGDDESINYVKPALRLRPMSGLFVQARPDFAGDYVYDLQWQPRRDWSAALHRDRRIDQLRVDRRWSSQWQGSVAATRDRQIDRRRDSVSVVYQESSLYGWHAELGMLHAQGDLGFLARVGRELVPGVQVRFDAMRDPLYRDDVLTGGTTAQLSLQFELGRAGGRFTRGGGPSLGHAGALGGAIVDGSGRNLQQAGVVVRIDGQPRARTDAHGRFHVAGLPPGVYRVDLDEEGLPIEWSVREEDRRWARVAVGAVTSVRFEVELRYGVAGRVIDPGSESSGLSIEVIDAGQRRIGTAQPNEFGYYRVDGLVPGDYLLRLLSGDRILAEREIRIEHDFLFEQDLSAPPSRTSGED